MSMTDALDVNTIIGVAIGYLIAALVRHLRRTRFWQGIERTASSWMRDPAVKVDNASDAVVLALVEAQRPQLERAASRVTAAPPMGDKHVSTTDASSKPLD
jgi:hypothetical protein